MKNITEIDKNFAVKTGIEREGIKFYDCMNEPFKIYGIFMENGKFRRMPQNIAESVSVGVNALHANTAGGRVRFVTDSPYVAIAASVGETCRMSHFALTGSCGFDLYADNVYIKTFTPPYEPTDSFDGIIEIGERKLREITINFPLYSEITGLYIGLDGDAVVKEAVPYKNDKPIVYYGSSITQGGCASRPGMAYQNIISRRLNCDFINLGFSGSAKAEDAMIDYIKDMDMSVFVYDYDHNAPDAEYLKKTHEKMFKAIRKKNPDLPIIIMTRPKVNLQEHEMAMRAVIENTYNNAVKAGDRNVYFISGDKLMSLCGNEGTVDNCHPTDFGFASMAKTLGDFMEENKLI